MTSTRLIVIDGSQGEGGGQVLRTALSLSLVTGQPFRIEKIRAKRAKPGLMRQHLTAVRAAQAISRANLKGAEVGSTALTFEPGAVRGGDYEFAVGTAGSATLVAQTVLPALLLNGPPSKIVLEGGTHNPHAPPFEFLDRAYLPILRQMGAKVSASLKRRGFFPAGGGQFELTVTPGEQLSPLELLGRGARRFARAEAVVANLPAGIAERELKVVARRLNWPEDALVVQRETDNLGPGNVLLMTVGFDHVCEVFSGFGEVGKTAEAVAERTIGAVRKHLKSEAAVGEYLADQLLLPMALAPSSHFTTSHLTSHATTNISVIRKFLPVDIDIEAVGNKLWRISVAR